jgi:hypothetical protein
MTPAYTLYTSEAKTDYTIPKGEYVTLADYKLMQEREARLVGAAQDVIKYLERLDKDVSIKPQKHLDLWPWSNLIAALHAPGEGDTHD